MSRSAWAILAETVTVEAAAPLVDVRSAGISEVVENERIVELPLQGRQVTDLIVLAGAAVATDHRQFRGASYPGSAHDLVAGGLSFGVGYFLDGALHNDSYNNLNLPLPFPDALQEFRVATSGLTAQNGVHSGASVNAVTKSGTNRVSGNAFEFLRDHQFNATNPFAAVGPDGKRQDDGLSRNQYGGTLGGPIVREPALLLRRVPGHADAPSSRRPPGVGADRRNAGRRFHGVCVTCVQRWPADRVACPVREQSAQSRSVQPGGAQRRRRSCRSQRTRAAPSPTERRLMTTSGRLWPRSTIQLSANHSVFGRYLHTDFSAQAAWPRTSNMLTTSVRGRPKVSTAKSLTFGDTLIFGSSMVNSLRVALNPTHVDIDLAPFLDAPSVGSKVYTYIPGQIVLDVTSAFSIGTGGSVKQYVDQEYLPDQR